MRHLIQKLGMLAAVLVLTACGAAGGGGSGGGGGASVDAQTIASLAGKLWAIPLGTTSHGTCAVAFKAGSNGKFGMAFICYNGGNQFFYEAALGSYSISGNSITLDATPDSCSSYKTIFWDPTDSDNSATYSFKVEGSNLVVTSASGVLRFVEVDTSNRSTFPFVATRGCYAKQGGSYSWIPYSQGQADDSVDNRIEQHAGGSGSGAYSKPKLDIVLFQDNSDSLSNAVAQLKFQLGPFLDDLGTHWDFRFVILPLLSQQSASSKVVIATDCAGVSSAGCVGPSSIAYYNSLAGDSGWINSRNSSTGNVDLGFQNMNYNLNALISSGFIRTDAALATIVFSNNDDHSGVSYITRPDGATGSIDYNSATTQASFNAYKNYFMSIKSSSQLSRMYSIVSAQSYSDCWGGGRTWAGIRYMNMAATMGGAGYDLCAGGLSSVLADIRARLVSVAQAIEFNYAVFPSEPNPASIQVRKNGNLLANSSSNGWTYVGYRSGATSFYPAAGNVRSGYMIKLNGAATLKATDTFELIYSP